jgi:copper oxidase (laccase) domain-containing protein
MAVMTRRGGVSVRLGDSHVGATVGDDIERVKENRKELLKTLGGMLKHIYDVWQVHSNDIVYTDAPRPANIPHVKADGISTNNPKVTLFMRFCRLCTRFYCLIPKNRWLACVHAVGWGQFLIL